MTGHADYNPALLNERDTYFRNESPPVINLDTGEVVKPTPESLLFVDAAGAHHARFMTNAHEDFTDVVLGPEALDRLIAWLTFLRNCEQVDIMGVAFEAARLAAKGGAKP